MRFGQFGIDFSKQAGCTWRNAFSLNTPRKKAAARVAAAFATMFNIAIQLSYREPRSFWSNAKSVLLISYRSYFLFLMKYSMMMSNLLLWESA